LLPLTVSSPRGCTVGASVFASSFLLLLLPLCRKGGLTPVLLFQGRKRLPCRAELCCPPLPGRKHCFALPCHLFLSPKNAYRGCTFRRLLQQQPPHSPLPCGSGGKTGCPSFVVVKGLLLAAPVVTQYATRSPSPIQSVNDDVLTTGLRFVCGLTAQWIPSFLKEETLHRAATANFSRSTISFIIPVVCRSQRCCPLSEP